MRYLNYKMHLTNYHFYNTKNYLYSKPVKGLQSYGVGYRFSFNGQENDDEVSGGGNSLDYGDRMYDSRLGRLKSPDPLFKLYPEISPYAFCNNNPIMYKEVEGRGFNGGFSITNQSTSPIVVVGTSKTIITNANGTKTESESPSSKVTLKPGQRLEAYYSETKDKDGNVTGKFTSRVVQFADLKDGKLVDRAKPTTIVADANAWDVDYIEVQKDQTFVDEGVFSDDKYNTNTKDKKAKTPNPPTGEGTIKIQPGKFDFYPDKDDANEGSVTITGNKDALKIKTGGELENEPKVDYGDGKPH
jgi:RHS repeat-associated protein